MNFAIRLTALLGLISSVFVIVNTQQQNVDPAYLRQYYQQLQQQQHQKQGGDATPIYEQNSEQSQQYVAQGQQYHLKDTVREQVQAQQQHQHQGGGYVAPVARDYAQHQPQVQQVQYQQQQYRPQPQAVSPPRHSQPQYQPQKAKLQQQRPQQQIDEEEYDDQNSSYQFGFDVKDDEFTNYQNRKEIRDGSVIKGSYSVVDSDGFIRTVKYTADPKEGFKAEVIREPTDIVVKIPTPAPQQLVRQTHKSQDYALKPSQQYHQPQQQQYHHPQQYQQ
ncbi:putative cyclin-dependent serine/threonine-protein kinase DDB_G0272797/DDB_G0274007 [Anastrepha obliqua]|uniref:putative cyclin-dependent serine/threonine-protein kinase DDB_G0272797/DDB_G0274007 n=1 Tax=Anastrepha ludens TaxID=28586 RepID=UPI0023AEE031|nr:putative cyclin-dependent serine/threonine-protein kinase DDB_G0272797/DDB_G0274007 [Anastrepha ludens]XP_054734012.1 putative cyclin-dependent serine/threonine-protein kinase DDB_G0272797/DDB_G0274007 [Anastrepha obliqua]XP_054734013.1 putative cyclin-dependent serine/threonine-protein kinase DDB_G0272797/DDB_G0274007 [Anastrepha obliqua]XP_054734014.1 putative cyclin-dependent serine/threonine-protein kinase DDB_G0272797/DDB_G0274007 [Anastrepha obliqua]